MLHRPFAEWDRSTLDCLLAEKVPESDRLDFKQSMDVDSAKGRREAAKDVSSLANTYGGHLIIGLEESEQDGSNVAVAIRPLTEETLQDKLPRQLAWSVLACA
jgi:predicted HTH transcriptional regulator